MAIVGRVPIVRIYSSPNYAGSTLNINYPVTIMNVKAVGWSDNFAQSLRIFKPNVTVTLYTNFDLKDDKNKRPLTYRSQSNVIGTDDGKNIYFQTPDFGKDYNNTLSSLTVQVDNFTPILSIYSSANYKDFRASFNYPVDIDYMKDIPFPNKALSSLTLAAGYILTLFSEPGYGFPQDNNGNIKIEFTKINDLTRPIRGQFLQILGPVDIPNLDASQYGFNDKTQSFSLQQYTPVVQPGALVTIYQDSNFQGKQRSFYTSVEVPNIDIANFASDSISSIKVAPGVIFEGFSDPNFTDRSLVLSGGADGLFVQSLKQSPYSFNDVITSFKITAPRYRISKKGITASIGQKTVYNGYKDGNCSNGDWKSSSRCSSLNPATCPLIGGVMPLLGIKWSNPGNNLNATMGPVDCIYDLAQFREPEDYNTLLKYVVNDPTSSVGWINSQDVLNAYDNILMPAYCSQQVDTCPTYPGITGPIKCSRFVSTGPDGAVCQKWIQRGLTGGTPSITPASANQTMISYCAKNKTPDCQCLNSTLKQQDPVYQIGLESLSRLNPNDACWYGPCSTTDPKYLRTSDMINPQCANLCINKVKLDSLTTGRDVKLDNITLQNVCPTTGPSVTPAPGVTPVPPAPGVTPVPSQLEPSVSPPSSPTTRGSSLPWILIGVGVLILFIIIGVVIFFVTKK